MKRLMMWDDGTSVYWYVKVTKWHVEHISPSYEGYSPRLLFTRDCEWPESDAISRGRRPREIAFDSGHSQSWGGNKRVL